MSNYSKFKERKPEDTIFYLQSILNKMDLFTTIEWIDKPFEGVRSNRVNIYPTGLGANGKGTDEVYTTASAYAELVERIENNLLAIRTIQPELSKYAGFCKHPDERVMTAEEILAQNDPFLTHYFHKLGLIFELQKKEHLRNTSRIAYKRDDGKCPCIPFVDLKNRKVVWLPFETVVSVYGSNGMAAGNTIEEALVQGISEIFERYMNAEILRGNCIPPQVPDEVLKKYSFWELIEQIRADDRYDVRVLDCSLGKGLPVAGTMIIDRKRGTFGLKLGSHPSLAVSVERTLTETFQGKDIEYATSINRFGTLQESTTYHNIPNVAKVGYGIYPYTLVAGEPQWEYKPWTRWEGLDNQGFLNGMLGLLNELGFSPLIRDSSHLGFPACMVIVPGLSEMYPIEPLMIRANNTVARNADSFNHFPELTDEEEKRFLNAIVFKEGSILENTFANMFMRPIAGKMFTLDRLGAILALKQGKYELSERLFKKVHLMETDEAEKQYLLCMTEYVRARANGLEHEEAARVLRLLYRESTALRVLDEVQDLTNILKKIYPRVTCFDCEQCPLDGKECVNRQEVEVNKRIKDAMKESRVSQEQLLEHLLQLLA